MDSVGYACATDGYSAAESVQRAISSQTGDTVTVSCG